MKKLLVIALMLVSCAKEKLQTDIVQSPPQVVSDNDEQILLLEKRILELEQQERDVNVYLNQVINYVVSVSSTVVVSHVTEVKEAEEIKEHTKKEKEDCKKKLKKLKRETKDE